MADMTGLGRRVLLKAGKRFQDEDEKHLLPKRPREAVGVIRRHWTSRGVLDQGSTSECVIHGADKLLTTFPVCNVGFLTRQRRTQIYKEVQKLDEWPGENYDGTSVRAMMKWLHKNGYIKEYKWAFDVEAVINHVLAFGPIEMGTIWDMDMSNPDRWGYIAPNKSAADDEGHAWTIIGADKERVHPKSKKVGAVRMINSWGDGWGDKGRAWITFEDLYRLIEAEGEAAVATEVLKSLAA